MRRPFYGMRRANGDWYALEVGGRNRVPVFRTPEGAWRARARNPELMLFRPAQIDERALEDLATADGGRPAAFWLVEEGDPALVLTRGRPLGFEQLATLEGAAHLPGAGLRTRAARQVGGGRGHRTASPRPPRPRAA